jgi:hypothetical protein
MDARALRLGFLSIVLLAATVAYAEAPSADAAPADWQRWMPRVHVYFRTFFVYQNDTDFDPTDPLYDENGQSKGHLATLLRPLFTFSPHEAVTIAYELEIGDNVWSQNDANQGDPTGQGRPIVRHRQFWGRLAFPGTPVSATAGYQYVFDPTHLVVDRYLGAARLDGTWKGGSASVGVAQFPDKVYEGNDPNQAGFDPDLEGFDPRRNNFQNDDFVFWAAVDQSLAGDALAFRPGVYVRWDRTVVKRPRWFAAPVVNLAWKPNPLVTLDLDLAGQFGNFENGGVDNRDLAIRAGAGQLGLTFDLDFFALRLGVLAFTGDDDRGDLVDGGFAYSGWSRSPTFLLTENALEDQFDNLDERVAAQRAGLVVADAQVTARVATGLSVFAVVGWGRTWTANDLGGDPTLGTEVDLGLTWDAVPDLARLNLLGGTLLPGEAAAALVNEIDTGETDPLWNVQGSIELRF